jgi:hypothetical protein
MVKALNVQLVSVLRPGRLNQGSSNRVLSSHLPNTHSSSRFASTSICKNHTSTVPGMRVCMSRFGSVRKVSFSHNILTRFVLYVMFVYAICLFHVSAVRSAVIARMVR